MLIHERSGGIPRTISVMCDNALLTGFGMARQPVDYEMVLEVARDFDLHETRVKDVPTLVNPGQPEISLVPPLESEKKTTPDASSQSSGVEAAPAVASRDLETKVEDDESESPVAEPRQMFGATKPRARFSFFGTR